MKIKKYVLLSITVLMALFTMPFFTDNKAHALSLTPGATTEYGSYSATVDKYNSTGSTVDISLPIIGGIGATYSIDDSSLFKFSYNFNDYYSGSIEITLTANTAYILGDCLFSVSGGWFHKGINSDPTTNGIPSLSTSSKVKKFIIDFYNTRSLEFVIIAPSGGDNIFTSATSFSLAMTTTNATSIEEYLIYINSALGGTNLKLDNVISTLNDLYNITYDYYQNGMAGTLTDILLSIQEKADYQVDEESVFAYYWVMSDLTNMKVDYSDGDISTVVSVVSGGRTRTLNVPAGVTYMFYYYTSLNNITFTSASNSGIVWNAEQIPPATTTWRLRRITIENPTESAINVYFTWGNDGDIVPLYLGDGRNMSMRMQSITHFDSPNLTTDLISQILDKLDDLFGGDGYDTSIYDNIVNTVNDFITSLRNYMPSSVHFQNDVDSLPEIDGRNSPFNFVGIRDLTEIIYSGLKENFPGFSVLVIGGLLVMIVKVFV